jgi:rsbT co-antagonist protein RsbR
MSEGSVSSFGRIGNARLLRNLYGITEEDLLQIQAFGAIAIPKIGEYIDGFYEWLIQLPEYHEFFSDPETLEHVKSQQRIYWTDFFQASVDDDYFEKRVKVGQTHAHISMPLSTYLAAMNVSLRLFTETLHEGGLTEVDYILALRSVTKLMHLDTAIVCEAYTEAVNETLSAHSKALMEMATPVTEVWSGILLMPIVGIIDSKRAQEIMTNALARVADSRARVFILDIGGVAVVDTAVANHLIKITKATGLMGCECTISGVSPAIAQTMVELGIDVGDVKTTAGLSDALPDAFRKIGLEIR